jgi:hypothetical protein
MLLQRSNLIITRLALNKNSRAMLRNRGNKMSICVLGRDCAIVSFVGLYFEELIARGG